MSEHVAAAKVQRLHTSSGVMDVWSPLSQHATKGARRQQWLLTTQSVAVARDAGVEYITMATRYIHVQLKGN